MEGGIKMLFFKWVKKGFFKLESASDKAPDIIVGAYYSLPKIEEFRGRGLKCIIMEVRKKGGLLQ